jgi:chromosome segregation ATPase
MGKKRTLAGHRSVESIREEWAPGHIAKLEKQVKKLTEALEEVTKERDDLKLRMEGLKALADKLSPTTEH